MNKYLKFLIGSVALLAFAACEGTIELAEDSSMSPEIFMQNAKNDVFVTLDQARQAADMFMNTNVQPQTRTAPDASSVYSISGDDGPLMHVVNYSGGGFVIVSATRNYLPILAFSETGAFDINSVKGGLSFWVDEMKAAIGESDKESDSFKAEMNRRWRLYEEDNCKTGEVGTKSPMTRSMTPAEIACMERCEELYAQYGDEGWNFSSLEGAEYIFEEAGYSDYYEQLCYSANFNHSGLSSSVVGWKMGSDYESIGPLLSTAWKQTSPYNYDCDGHDAGCAAIALAQLMKYYEYPHSLRYRNYTFGWDSVPVEADTAHVTNQSKLIRAVGDTLNMHYWDFGSWTTPGDMKRGIESLGYNVTKQADCAIDVELELLRNHRPVIMLGQNSNTEFLPGSLAYIGDSHYWVVDGARKIVNDIFMVFAEWQPFDCGQFTQSYNSIDSPEILGGLPYLYYNCNWGNGPNDISWHAFDYNRYQYARQNFLISVPQNS